MAWLPNNGIDAIPPEQSSKEREAVQKDFAKE